MDARTREAGKALLENYYQRQSGPIAFIDESFRGNERPDEFPFYILSATLIESRQLGEVRESLKIAAQGTFWHTTSAYRDRNLSSIWRMIDVVSNAVLGVRIAIQVDFEAGSLEHARRECLVQLSALLSKEGCGLAIYEKRNTRAKNSSDASLMNRVKSFDPQAGLAVVGSHPEIEPMLWCPDLVSWCMRQEVTVRKRLWFEDFRVVSQVIDVSGKYSEKAKRPETAAARNSGPVLPADPEGDRASRSSASIISQHEEDIQEVFKGFGNVVEPMLEPKVLRGWILNQFPD